MKKKKKRHTRPIGEEQISPLLVAKPQLKPYGATVVCCHRLNNIRIVSLFLLNPPSQAVTLTWQVRIINANLRIE